MFFFGCATTKNATESHMTVSAEGTLDGIVLHIENIPEDTSDIYIALVDIQAKNTLESYVMINYDALDELKTTGRFLCPFAEKGHEYFIRVYRLFCDDAERFSTGAIAGGGIHLTNEPLLSFNDKNDRITLSEKPRFSEESLNSQKSVFDYSVFVKVDGMLHGGGPRSEQFTCDIPYLFTETQEAFGFSGELPVVASVHSVLNYENLEWGIGLAQTEDTIVTF
jgi:hypothetical protein